ncbi:MAG: ABC transporter permease [Planctomycetota bacterium]
MSFFEICFAAMFELWCNKFRSILTTLGIIIAVMSVIAVVSLMEGMSTYIKTYIQGMGSDSIWVSPKINPKNIGRVKLTIEDCETLRTKCSALKRTTPLLQQTGEVRYKNHSFSVPLTGTDRLFQETRDWYVKSGRFFSSLDLFSGKNVCVVGREILNKLEIDEKLIGQYLKVEKKRLLVIGVLESKGSFFGSSQDNTILVPFKTAVRLYGPQSGERIAILCQAKNSEMAEEATVQIASILRKQHQLSTDQPDDFRIDTQDQMLGFFTKASKVTTVVLAGIVSISLLVGGIGIMNIMLVSVTERTKEIGILKALGARDKDILLQFLIEAIVLSLFGGLIGIMAGGLTAYGIAYLSSLPEARIPLWSVALAFAFSVGVGIFFGMYPAVKASQLNPIEALRYE